MAETDWKKALGRSAVSPLWAAEGVSRDQGWHDKADLENIPLIGGLFGDPDKYDKRSQEYMDKAMREYEGLSAPELQDLEFGKYDWLGDLENQGIEYQSLDPRLQGQSQMGDIAIDPRLKDAQMAALGSLQEIGDAGGMTASDQANLSRIQSQTGQADRGRREAIKQSMAQRGMGGSGMDLLAQLQSNQAATDRSAQQGLDVAGMAQDRALQAIQMGGGMAGDLRGQSFGEQSQQATAQDAINRFNTGNMNQMSQFNAQQQMEADRFSADAANQANLYNVSGRQSTADRNVDTGNQQQQYNQNLQQQGFKNEMDLAGGKAGVYGAQAGYNTGIADRKQKAKSEVTGNLIKGGLAAYGA